MVQSRRHSPLAGLALLIVLSIVVAACGEASDGQGGGGGSAAGSADWPTELPWTPAPWTPTPMPSVPSIPGVSPTCATAMVEHSAAPFIDAVLRACPSLEELLLAASHLGTGSASSWESFARDACAADSTIPLCAALEPTAPPPTPLPDSVVRSRCTSARPKNVYSVTAAVTSRTPPLRGQAVRVFLVELRDLAGKVTTEPRLKDSTFYEFQPFYAGNRSYGTPVALDAIACVALRATELEHWYYQYDPGTLYPVLASNAILWLADAKTGKAIGKPWLVRPPASDSGENYIYFGDGGPGQRAPRESQILASIEKSYGL